MTAASVAAQQALLNVEDGADVTDATNVAAAGAVMDGDFSTNGLMKRTGVGAYSTATEGTDYYAPSGTDVAIVDGGTGASTAAGALAALSAAGRYTSNATVKALGSSASTVALHMVG